MTKVHKQATFQPTIRPSWAGAMSYIPVEEKAQILDALVKYPEIVEIDSIFWKETIKPDLDLQYNKFIATCEARKQVARTYWDNQKTTNGIQLHTKCISKDIQMVINTKDKDKDKDKDKNKQYIELVNILRTNLEQKKNGRKININGWYDHIRKMVEVDKIGVDEIKKALDWYFKHFGEMYVPVIESASSLREKFSKLENSIERDKKYSIEKKSKAQIIEEHNLKHIEELFGGV